jgi:hypothetical protein
MSDNENKLHWSELYRQALFEDDQEKLPKLLEVAYKAAQQRVHEIWYEPAAAERVTAAERRELDAAIYYLGLLRKMEQANAAARMA